MVIKTVGSVCSGIEAASVAWIPLAMDFKWFSEIAAFPSKVLNVRYPDVPNVGDMTNIPEKILSDEIEAPDVLCGGTPCQAFSVAGWQQGLEDDRGNLTLKFVDIVEANDAKRKELHLDPSVVFWENVEGVLTDKTNAFGSFISSLAGLRDSLYRKKWPTAGVLKGPKRNIAWRVMDAKYFGLPQQRRRLYLLAGGENFNPENVLFEVGTSGESDYPENGLSFSVGGKKFELFREYTDCLYSAYGTKWNGNAAAYNGSLYVVQDGKIRRLSPLECERLMGFPDGYTDIEGATRTNRYQALGNSWAVPVIRWIGARLAAGLQTAQRSVPEMERTSVDLTGEGDYVFHDLTQIRLIDSCGRVLNSSTVPTTPVFGDLRTIVDVNPPNEIFISPTGCYGIVRRKNERNLKINGRLEQVLIRVAKQSTIDAIEKRSRVQRRGRFSSNKCGREMQLF